MNENTKKYYGIHDPFTDNENKEETKIMRTFGKTKRLLSETNLKLHRIKHPEQHKSDIDAINTSLETIDRIINKMIEKEDVLNRKASLEEEAYYQKIMENMKYNGINLPTDTIPVSEDIIIERKL